MNPAFSTCQKSNGVQAMFARNVDIPIIVKAVSPTPVGVLVVNMMRVRQQELCLISVNFHCIWLFT